MGNGASIEGNETEEKFRSTVNKVKVCRIMKGERPMATHKNRDELRDIIQAAKSEVQKDWNTINAPAPEPKGFGTKPQWKNISSKTSTFYKGTKQVRLNFNCLSMTNFYNNDLIVNCSSIYRHTRNISFKYLQFFLNLTKYIFTK